MANKFTRNITKVKDILKLGLNVTNQNDLVSDSEDAYIRNQNEYHCLTDNVKSVTVNGQNYKSDKKNKNRVAIGNFVKRLKVNGVETPDVGANGTLELTLPNGEGLTYSFNGRALYVIGDVTEKIKVLTHNDVEVAGVYVPQQNITYYRINFNSNGEAIADIHIFENGEEHTVIPLRMFTPDWKMATHDSIEHIRNKPRKTIDNQIFSIREQYVFKDDKHLIVFDLFSGNESGVQYNSNHKILFRWIRYDGIVKQKLNSIQRFPSTDPDFPYRYYVDIEEDVDNLEAIKVVLFENGIITGSNTTTIFSRTVPIRRPS